MQAALITRIKELMEHTAGEQCVEEFKRLQWRSTWHLQNCGKDMPCFPPSSVGIVSDAEAQKAQKRHDCPVCFESFHLSITPHRASVEVSPTMDNATLGMSGSVEPVSVDSPGSSPAPLEIVLGILAVVLGVAAVTVAIAQFRQGRAVRSLAQTHRQSGQPDVEMPNPTSHDADADPVVVTTPKQVANLMVSCRL